MNAKEISEEGIVTDDADIKQEPLDSEPEENYLMVEVPGMKLFVSDNAVEDNKPLLINSVIKQEPTSSADSEPINSQVQSRQMHLQRLPSYAHTDVKQEPMDVYKTDPDDVTTQSIPEESEQHEMEDIKFVNTPNYLDIGETVICEQNRAISEQDRARPGTSPKENQSGTEARKNKLDEKPHRCEICDRRFPFLGYLTKHMRAHTGEKPYKCEALGCGRRFTFINYLTKHMRTHTGEKPYKCEACDYRCTQSTNLKAHMRTHTAEKPYKCEACDYRCTVGSSLKTHMRTHSGEKPFKCKACIYRCTDGKSLKIHMRTHTGEKPYKCEVCDYRCIQNGDLKRHMKIHTGEKPFKCEACDYRCTQGSSLKRHMRTHTGGKSV